MSESPARQHTGISATERDVELQESDSVVCRYCLEPAENCPGGVLSKPCSCTAPVHDRCLSKWLLSSHNMDGVRDCRVCECCKSRWQGNITVPIDVFVEQLAALRSPPSNPGRTVQQPAALQRAAAVQSGVEWGFQAAVRTLLYEGQDSVREQLARRLAEVEVAEQARQRAFVAVKAEMDDAVACMQRELEVLRGLSAERAQEMERLQSQLASLKRQLDGVGPELEWLRWRLAQLQRLTDSKAGQETVPEARAHVRGLEERGPPAQQELQQEVTAQQQEAQHSPPALQDQQPCRKRRLE